jgi:hypothetical protein
VEKATGMRADLEENFYKMVEERWRRKPDWPCWIKKFQERVDREGRIVFSIGDDRIAFGNRLSLELD